MTTISSIFIPIPHISIRPYRLDRVIGYYDNFLRRLRTIYDCTYTYDAQRAHLSVEMLDIWKLNAAQSL